MAVYKKTARLEFTEDDTFNHHLGYLLSTQRGEGLYCDLSLVVNGHSAHVHKGVLAARCDYFAVMFRHSFSEFSANSIDMSYVFPTVSVMEIILDYLYNGKIVLDGENIEAILQSASHLLLDSLFGYCAQYLLSNLGPHNCVQTWALADTYHMPKLALIARHMTKSRFQDSVLIHDRSLDIPAQFLIKVIKEAMPDRFDKDRFLNFLSMWCRTEQVEEKMEALKYILQITLQAEYQDGDIMRQLGKYENKAGHMCSQFAHEMSTPSFQKSECSHEALISYLPESNGETNGIQLHIYAYLIEVHLWITLGAVNVPTPACDSQWETLGIITNNLILRSQNPRQLLSVDLVSSKNVDITSPVCHPESLGLASFNEFCYANRIFCIMEDECRIPLLRSAVSSMALTDYFTTVRSLMVYDPNRNTWIPCCRVPVPEVKCRHKVALKYHIIDAGDVAYVWAMDVDWQEDTVSGGPFWMKLSPADGENEIEYRMTLEAVPPLSSQEWEGKDVKLMGTKEGILVYGTSKLCNMFMPMLLYNTQTHKWSTLEEPVLDYPHVALPLIGGTSSAEAVFISQSMTVQSLPPTGILFHLEDLCPDVSIFWALDTQSMTWKELPAPPSVGLRNFVVCRVGTDILLHLKHTDIEHSRRLLADEGPLFDFRLPKVTSNFRSVTSQCTTPPTEGAL